ncbi:PucR family transcriptional regulator [Streptomyces nitrosporeus]|nr:helix-turn-helix domain-containing protein [Streptomyces nitrosporeus]
MNMRAAPAEHTGGIDLRMLASALGADVSQAGAREAGDVVIAEPGETPVAAPGSLVLAVGARGPAAAAAMVRTAARAGAAGVVLRLDEGEEALPRAVLDASLGMGVTVLGIGRQVPWERVDREARRARPGRRGDLFALAQTMATVTCGLASVEDSAHRVLAYAGPAEEADELRRLSVLGRHCPDRFLALLRDLGVYRRTREDGEVVAVDARPGLGLRRRLVVGVNAGGRPLGTIWVQEGDRPLAANSEEMLRGAARLAVPQLIDHYYEGDAAARSLSRTDLAHGLLTGRFDPSALAAHLGVTPDAAATVVAFDLREPAAPDTAGDDAGHEARLAEAAAITAVHAAAHRSGALVARACGQIYVMLPEPSVSRTGPHEGADTGEAALVRWADEVVTALRRHTRTPVQAVVAGRAGRLVDIPSVKLRGHRALEVMARTPERTVATHRVLIPSLMVRDLLGLLDGHTDIRHPGLAALVSRDAEQGTRLADSLLRYLDAFGDVPRVAKELNIHPNTLRYRIRKASALAGLDLDDPEHRLVAMLQLRLTGGGQRGACPFPGL